MVMSWRISYWPDRITIGYLLIAQKCLTGLIWWGFFLKIFGGILPVIVISTPSYLSFWTKWRIFFTLGWSWLVQSYRLNQKFLYSQTVRKWHPHWIKGNIWFRLQAWTSAKFNIEWGGGKIYYPSGIAVDSERILLKRLAIHPSRSIGRVMGNR